MSAGRRSISLARPVFDRFRENCARRRVSCSGQLEALLADLAQGRTPRTRRANETATWGPHYLHPLRPKRAYVRKEPTIETHAPSGPVVLVLSRATVELVEDSLGDVRPGRGKHPLRSEHELSRVLDTAIVRMLDAYSEIAARADHCAICRSKMSPFVPVLAGESVVAVCAVCVREGRQLDGARRRIA